ncbi:MAG: hypothetical protein ACE5EN_04780 [Nitrospinota bacterium]
MSKFKIDFLTEYDDKSLLSELKRISKTLDKHTITKQDIEKHGRVSYVSIYKRFGSLHRNDLRKYNFPVSGDTFYREFGSWKKALKKAYDSIQLSDEFIEKTRTKSIREKPADCGTETLIA